MLSGLIQPTVFTARMFSGTRKNAKGDVVAIRDSATPEGVPFGGQNAADVLWSFIRSKLSPGAGMVVNLADGQNVVGEPTDLPNQLREMVTPLSLSDFAGMLEEHGVPKAVALQMVVTFGAGAQTYGDGGYTENMGDIDRIIKDAREAVENETTEKGKRAEWDRRKAEHPWLLKDAQLDSYSFISSKGRVNTRNLKRGLAGKIKPGAPIKNLPEFVKGDDKKLISAISSAREDLKSEVKFSELIDSATEKKIDITEQSATLKRAIEGGNLDRKIPRGMRKDIFRELEKSALRIKQTEVAKIRSAKGN